MARRNWLIGLAAGLWVMSAASVGATAERAGAAREDVNQATVAVMSGGVNGTYIRIASDMAAVLDRGDALRILPIVGKGSVQNVTDLLYLRGVDVAIVQSDVLGFLRKEKMHGGLEERLRYITKLYNEEVHVLAARDVAQMQDLAGKRVNVDVAGSGTAMTASILFDALDIRVDPTNYDQALALEKLKGGEIAAMVFIAGKPTDLFRRIPPNSGLHFVSVPFTRDLLQIYLPSSLSHADYPALVPEDQPADTVAVGAVLAVYNWNRQGERYKRVAAFVDALFDGFGEFLKPPRHPKWQEVNLAAELPGWTRFTPAEEWLQRRPSTAGVGYDLSLRNSFEEFLKFMNETGGRSDRPADARTREALFARFLEWRNRQAAPAASPGPALPAEALSPSPSPRPAAAPR